MQKHFSEYFRPTEPETTTLWAEAVFVFDTNVLLNLYRMSRETSLKIKSILCRLKGRLFLPHQVGVEFFRNLEEEITRQVNAFEQVRQYLKKIPETFSKDFSRHSCIPIAEIKKALTQCTDDQITIVDKCQEANQLNFLTHGDPILPELNDIFSDCSEEPYKGAADDALNTKVDERCNQNTAPCCVSTGGKDLPPPASNPHRGDGRVWFQIVRHAATTLKPIIFVTGDVQPNWWRTARLGNHPKPIGPHFQLTRDVESVSGNRFLMYSQEEFLSKAPKYLGVTDQMEAAIEEVRQIRESASTERDSELLDDPKTTFREESQSLEKGEPDQESELAEQDPGLLDDPKASPLEELKSLDKAEKGGEVD